MNKKRFIPLLVVMLLGARTLHAATSAIANLSATQGSQVRLTWTAPDNGTPGQTCTSYMVKYSTTANILNDSDFEQATEYVQNWIPQTPGMAEAQALTGLLPETPYYFSIKSFNGSEWSVISSTGANSTTSGIFYDMWCSSDTAEWRWVSVGDADNDGYLDMMTGMASVAQPNRLYRNNGDKTFTQVWTAAENTYKHIWGDYDNDGDLDMLSASKIYKNNGGNTFSLAWASPTTENNTTWADYDNDGDLDYLATEAGQKTRIYRNGGNSSFALSWESPTTFDLSFVYITSADSDNDGDLDVLFGLVSGGQANRLYKNNGGGTLTLAWTAPQVTASGSTAWGDCDNDGDLDILAASDANRQNRVYRNDGNNSFALAWTAPSADYAPSCAWGDYDNDGDLDQLMGYSNGRQNRIYRNDGSNNFSLAWTCPRTDATYMIAWADFDNDSDLDQVVSNCSQRLRIYASEYARKQVNTAPVPPDTFTSVNADGMVKLQWAENNFDIETSSKSLYYAVRVGTTQNSSSTVSGCYGTPLMGAFVRPSGAADQVGLKLHLPGDTTYYWSVRTIDAGLRASGWSVEQSTYMPVMSPQPVTGLVAVPDFQIKLTWASPSGFASSYVLRYSTSGSITDETEWDQATEYPQGWSPAFPPGSIETKYLTGLMPETTCWFALKASNAGGTCALDTSFPEPNAIPSVFYSVWVSSEQLQTRSVALGDYDNDNDLDLLSGQNNGYTRIYQNTGNESYSMVWMSPEINYTQYASAWGDYDNDGDLDAYISGGGSIRVYRNEGSGLFTHGWGGPGASGYTMSVGDYDNDGDLDLFTGWGGINCTGFFRNHGNSSFTLDWQFNSPSTYASALGDCDNDGDLDLFLGFSGAASRVYRNDGITGFSLLWTAPTSDNTYGAAWGDYDNDGNLDALSATTPQKIYKNNGDYQFALAWTAPVSEASRAVAWCDYDNDGDLDHMVGCYGFKSMVYRNDGGDNHVSGIVLPYTDFTNGVAVGDIDTDGDIDYAVGNANGSYGRVYSSAYSAKIQNTPPSVPSGMDTAYSNGYVQLKWAGDGSYDTITSSSGLCFAVRVAETSRSSSTLSGCFSPSLFNTVARRIAPSEAGIMLNLRGNTTYYWSVKTIDAGFASSGWSVEQSTYIPVYTPYVITGLTAVTDSQVKLSWTAPLGFPVSYEMRYSTVGAITNESEWSAATAFAQSWVPAAPGYAETKYLTGLISGTTHWFAIKSANSEGVSDLDISYPEPNAVADPFLLSYKACSAYCC